MYIQNTFNQDTFNQASRPGTNGTDMTNRSGESPFKPDYDDYIKVFPGRGKLKVQISAAREAFPVKGVMVDVAFIYNGVRYSIYNDVTDSSGIVNNMVLPARLTDLIIKPEINDADEAHYLISLYHPAFKPITDLDVTVYDKIETILPISLIPVAQRSEGN